MSTDKTIEQEIQESIAKHLPTQVGTTLRERLEQADRDSNTVKANAEKIVRLEGELRLLNSYKDGERVNRERTAALDKQKAEQDELGRSLRVKELELSLAAEQRVSKALDGALAGLVRNIDYRRSVFGSHEVLEPPQGPGYSSNQRRLSEDRNHTESAG